MDDLFARIWTDLGGRVGGPLSARLLLQPAIAIVLAVKGGFADAKAGRPAYFWGLLTHPAERREMLRDGWKAITTVFVMAIVLDAIYQLIVFRWIYPGETVMVAFILACVPYLIVRGLANRLRGAEAAGKAEQP